MKLMILETSDTHGYIFSKSYRKRSEQDGIFGLLRAKSLFDSVYADYGRENVLSIENGDILQGSAFASYMTHKQNDRVIADFQFAYNSLGYDFSVLGNHDFNYGRELLQKNIAVEERQLLNANIVDESTNSSFMGQPYAIVKRGGLNIAVIGVTTQYVPHWEDESNIRSLVFQDAVVTVKKLVEKLRPEVDLVVVSYHGGFERDLVTGEPTERITGENQGYEMLEKVPGIDVLLTGHQHRKIATMYNDVAIVQPGYQAEFVAAVEIDYANVAGKVKIRNKTPKLIPTKDFPVDRITSSYLAKTEEDVQDWLDIPVGQLEKPLRIENASAARIADHPYLNFIHQVQLATTGADLSATAIIKEDAPGFSTDITRRDLLLNYPYSNQLVKVELNGEELRDILEYSATFFVRNKQNGAVEFDQKFLKPKYQLYHFDSFYPVSYEINVDAAIGSRVQKLLFEGKEVQSKQRFTLAVSKYRANGGGTYPVYPNLTVVSEYDPEITELIESYLQKNSPVKVNTQKNYRIF